MKTAQNIQGQQQKCCYIGFFVANKILVEHYHPFFANLYHFAYATFIKKKTFHLFDLFYTGNDFANIIMFYC